MSYIDNTKLYVYRLKQAGEREVLNFFLNPELFQEDGLENVFSKPIHIEGYLERVDDEQLVLNLKINSELGSQCPICDRWFLREVVLEDICTLIDNETLSGGVYDCKDLVRQELLLSLESFQECSKNGCPERSFIVEFLEEEKKKKYKGESPFDKL